MTAAQTPAARRVPRSAVAVAAAVVVVVFGLWANHRIAGLDWATRAKNPIFQWEWLFTRERTPGELSKRLRQHLELTVIPVAIGFALASVLSLFALRFRWTIGPLLGFAGVLYTIPSLALFGVLQTYNTNWTAAVVALTSYTLLILMRAMIGGIDGVPASVRDAADGLGLSKVQKFWQVELPLALPVILTGVRVATVTTIGLVGISAVIQLGGLAYFIFDGYKRSITTLLIVGSALSVLLAVVLDLALRGLERVLTPWTRRTRR